MGYNILYVEDSPVNMLLVRRRLEAAGHTLIEAADGEAGLTAAALEKPDLILLDIHLPGISGFEIVKALKAAPSLCHIPVVALTGTNTMYGDRERCFEAGFDGYLAKPISRNELLNTISNLLTIA